VPLIKQVVPEGMFTAVVRRKFALVAPGSRQRLP
jgi:hypothetical protein